MRSLQKTIRYLLEHLIPRDSLNAEERLALEQVLRAGEPAQYHALASQLLESLTASGRLEKLGTGHFRDKVTGDSFRLPPASRSVAAPQPASAISDALYGEVLSSFRFIGNRPGAPLGLGRIMDKLPEWLPGATSMLYTFLPIPELEELLGERCQTLEPTTLASSHPYRLLLPQLDLGEFSLPEVDFGGFPAVAAEGKGTLALLPLHLEGEAWGLLELVFEDGRIEDEVRSRIRLIGEALSHQLFNHRVLSRVVFIDGLTQVYNRNFLDIQLPLEVERANRNREQLALIVCDMDDFKKVNDRFGHDVGDAVLREMGALLRQTLRKVDQVFRFGGEEFVVLLPRLALESAFRAAERIRLAVASHPFAILGGDEKLRLTVSIGGAIYPLDATDETALFKVADEAAYRAKRGGKNRVVFSTSSEARA